MILIVRKMKSYLKHLIMIKVMMIQLDKLNKPIQHKINQLKILNHLIRKRTRLLKRFKRLKNKIQKRLLLMMNKSNY